MFKRVTEIKTQPVLILAATSFVPQGELIPMEKSINARLKLNQETDMRAIVLPGCLQVDSWQYGRVETVTETTDEEPGEYMTADVFTPDGKGGADDAETQDASGTAGDI